MYKFNGCTIVHLDLVQVEFQRAQKSVRVTYNVHTRTVVHHNLESSITYCHLLPVPTI